MSVKPRFSQVAANLDSNPKIRRGGRLAREVFCFALRRNAEVDNPVKGRLPGAVLEPWFIADMLMMPEAEAIEGLNAAERVGLLKRDGESWLISGWEEHWGERPLDGAERQAKYRERKRVTKSDEAPVTPSSPNVTVTTSDALDQSRSEEKREDPSVTNSGSTKASSTEIRSKPKTLKFKMPEGWRPSRSEANIEAENAATARGIVLREEFLKLVDWAKGSNAKKADWDATWRNWTRNAKPLSGRSHAPTDKPREINRL